MNNISKPDLDKLQDYVESTSLEHVVGDLIGVKERYEEALEWLEAAIHIARQSGRHAKILDEAEDFCVQAFEELDCDDD